MYFIFASQEKLMTQKRWKDNISFPEGENIAPNNSVGNTVVNTIPQLFQGVQRECRKHEHVLQYNLF